MSVEAVGQARVALVIGNSDYQHFTVLPNPKNDAEGVASVLRSLGFEVVLAENSDLQSFHNHLRKFEYLSSNADVSLLFYAGHALQVNGENYLVPVDVKLQSEIQLRINTVKLQDVLESMKDARINLIFLDACRDDPLGGSVPGAARTRSGSLSRGLAVFKTQSEGSFIAFATEPGNVALDGEGRHSPFSAALIRNLDTPGQTINELMQVVTKEVRRVTSNQQTPWSHTSLTDQFWFNDKSNSNDLSSGLEQPRVDSGQGAATNPQNLELGDWMAALRENTIDGYERFVILQPGSRYKEEAIERAVKLRKEAQQRHLAAEPVPEWWLAEYESVDFFGGDLGPAIPTGSFRQCAQICADNLQCNFFTYSENRCFLKEDFDFVALSRRSSAGFFFRDVEDRGAPARKPVFDRPWKWTENLGIDTSIIRTTTRDIASCVKWCEDHSICNFVTYRSKGTSNCRAGTSILASLRKVVGERGSHSFEPIEMEVEPSRITKMGLDRPFIASR
ncbi:MAG: caspase family protein [Rhizobiaceae bacterium]